MPEHESCGTYRLKLHTKKKPKNIIHLNTKFDLSVILFISNFALNSFMLKILSFNFLFTLAMEGQPVKKESSESISSFL